jgi:hypothetical protein
LTCLLFFFLKQTPPLKYKQVHPHPSLNPFTQFNQDKMNGHSESLQTGYGYKSLQQDTKWKREQQNFTPSCSYQINFVHIRILTRRETKRKLYKLARQWYTDHATTHWEPTPNITVTFKKRVKIAQTFCTYSLLAKKKKKQRLKTKYEFSFFLLWFLHLPQ